jgi:SAM-dependent methyltransferase
MSLGYPTIDLTEHPEHAKRAWEDLRVRLQQLADYNLEAHLSQIEMLEIGCGKAEFLRYAIEHGANIVGIDRNLFGIDDLPITQADIETRIPFDDDAFDLLYARGVFDPIHRFDPDRAFKEIQRVMKTGALFAIEGARQPDFNIAKRHGLELTNPTFADYYSVLRKE